MNIIHSHDEHVENLELPEIIQEVLTEEVLASEPTVAVVDSYQVDVLGQLHANVNKLQELQSRLSFMMNEVTGLIRRT